jgi:hypothetical protein
MIHAFDNMLLLNSGQRNNKKRGNKHGIKQKKYYTY